ncbi:MAG TPA: hypothetical protein VN238_04935, partial [Solirubrobacteraceae bacterium]|nr:hypothetical protein [Solirubrobacteraceae bacterium]
MGLNRRPSRTREAAFEITDDLDADFDATGHFAPRAARARPDAARREAGDDAGAPHDDAPVAPSGPERVSEPTRRRLTVGAVRLPRVEAVLALAACVAAVIAIVIAGRGPDAPSAARTTTVVTVPARVSEPPARARRPRAATRQTTRR